MYPMGNVVENRDHFTHVFDGEDRVEHLALLAMMFPQRREEADAKD